MLPEMTYYHISSEAKLDATGLSSEDLPPMPRSTLHVAHRRDRPIVAFRDPTQYPALEYISRFPQVGTGKDTSQTQRDYLRCLNRIIQAGDRHNFGLHWKVPDHGSQDGEFLIGLIPALGEYADMVSQAKGYGDESKRPPSQPYVPLRTEGPNLHKLVSFLEAESLSPTSHHIRKGYRDGRSTREPPKLDRDTDHEYRRAARSAFSVKLGWHLLTDIAHCPTMSPENKL